MKNHTGHKIFKNQGYHLIVWLALGGVLFFENLVFGGERTELVWGWSAFEWVVFSWVFAALHQGWVWFFWRMELHKKAISGWFGSNGFLIFRLGFGIFSLARFLAIIPVSMATPDSVPVPTWLTIGIIVVTSPFILWGIYCVAVYFGATRAFGADHFDPSYRGGSLEKRGIFRYVSNTMYTVILLGLYHPGLLLQSHLGLTVALVHHLFVWTHYFCTERPDMKVIYGANRTE